MKILGYLMLLIYPMVIYVIYSGHLTINEYQLDKEKQKMDTVSWIFTILLLWMLLRLVNKI